MNRPGGLFRVLWYSVLATLVISAFLAFYVIGGDGLVPQAVGTADGKASGIPVMVWILGGLGLLSAVFGARTARSVFLPEWMPPEVLVSRDGTDDGSDRRNAALAVFILGLGLIEITAVSALVLYSVTGRFNLYILLTGIALIGWVVARPESPDGPTLNGRGPE